MLLKDRYFNMALKRREKNSSYVLGIRFFPEFVYLMIEIFDIEMHCIKPF